jgi:hypothetical protein
MGKSARLVTSFVFALAFAALAIGCQATLAQTTLTGEWKATPARDKSDREKTGKINLSFERRDERGGHNQMGNDYDLAELQGLSPAQVAGGGAVRFRIAREAGTIDCEGSFENGRGSGTFRFTGSQNFVAAMKSRGFDFEQESSRRAEGDDIENRLFAAATINVTTALADDLLSADFGRLDVDDLFKAAIFKVDSKFMREMKASGFPGLGMEELVKARIFKIDADFVREVARMGFDKESFESIVKMRIFKVTPEFIAEVRNEGLNNLSVEELVKMRIFKIDAAFIRSAKADGVPLEVEELVHRRIMGRGEKSYQ